MAEQVNTVDRDRSPLLTGALIGIGIIGFLDEALLHQILQWHNFYWGTDQAGRVLSDGIFHVVSTVLLLWGTYRLWRYEQAAPDRVRGLVAGIFLGGGAFNLYDGVIQHAVLHLHLVNEKVCPDVFANNSLATCAADIPFEIAFDLVAVVLLTIGFVQLRRTRSAAPQPLASQPQGS
ncbi:MAG: DUF2243 domain-containing protein [Candidatus Dormibacteria bacterium]